MALVPHRQLSRLRICFYQDIDVFRRARLRVNRYRVSADNKIFNAVRVQNGQEFFVV